MINSLQTPSDSELITMSEGMSWPRTPNCTYQNQLLGNFKYFISTEEEFKYSQILPFTFYVFQLSVKERSDYN